MTTEADRFATPRVAAGVLFRDAEGRVLLVKPTYKDGWEIPGGYVEAGESPRAAAVREVHEELGLDAELADMLVLDWAHTQPKATSCSSSSTAATSATNPSRR